MSAETATSHRGLAQSYLRFPLSTRLLHWTAAVSILILLWSGFWIFNIHPRLYWGEVGYFGAPAAAEIVADTSGETPQFEIRIGDFSFDVTGVMGRVNRNPYVRVASFPEGFSFGGTRALHFTAAWAFFIAWMLYIYHLIGSGRLRHTWLPQRQELTAKLIGRDIANHLKFRRARGEASKRYNTLQKLTYLSVMFVLLPLVVLSGLTMSNTVTTAFPFLFDLFGGRQSARTMHFIFASLLVLFMLIHIFQLFVVGFVNHLRSMITGRFTVEAEAETSEASAKQ